VTGGADAFRMITDKQERHELDTGKNPWDIIAETFYKADFKPKPHRVVASHPQCKNANPAELPAKAYSAGDLYIRWTKFKTNVTTWIRNHEASGNHDSDKYNFTNIGTGMLCCYFLLMLLMMFALVAIFSSTGFASCYFCWISCMLLMLMVLLVQVGNGSLIGGSFTYGSIWMHPIW
jgi:hypothetical protein